MLFWRYRQQKAGFTDFKVYGNWIFACYSKKAGLIVCNSPFNFYLGSVILFKNITEGKR